MVIPPAIGSRCGILSPVVARTPLSAKSPPRRKRGMPPRKTGTDLYGGAARPCSTPSLRVSEAARSPRSLIPARSLEHVVARGRWEPAAPVPAAERPDPAAALRHGDPDGDKRQDHC